MKLILAKLTGKFLLQNGEITWHENIEYNHRITFRRIENYFSIIFIASLTVLFIFISNISLRRT